MGIWSIILPEAAANLIANPSFETGIDGATAVNSSSLSQSTDEQAVGTASLEVDPTTNTTGGVYLAISSVATTTTYTASFSIKGVAGVDYETYLYVNGAQIGDAIEFTGDGTWRRYNVTATTGASSSGPRLYIRKNNDADSNPFYIDAVQVEAKPYATTYCDGDQEGCTWAGGAHSSISSRPIDAPGGQLIDLTTDPNDADSYAASTYNFDIKASIGVGMPPIDLIDTLPAQSDGADHQRTIVRPRQFQLVGHITGTSWSNLLSQRLSLIQALNAHRLPTDRPVEVRYTLNGKSIAIKARYQGGLEKGEMLGNAVEEVSLRFKAQEDPFWRKAMGVGSGASGAGGGVIIANVQESLTSVSLIAQRDENGNWDNLDGGLTSASTPLECQHIALDNDGVLYAGWYDDDGGGRYYISKYEDGSWSVISGSILSGSAGESIGGLAIDANNDLIAVGKFPDISSSGVARYSKSTGSWTNLNYTGSFTRVSAVAVAPNGNIFVGEFGTTRYIKKYNGSSWSTVCTVTGTSTYIINRLIFNRNGRLYAAGSWITGIDGTTVAGVGYSDDQGANWVSAGDGIDEDIVRAIALAEDDSLWIGAYESGAVGPAYLYRFNGVSMQKFNDYLQIESTGLGTIDAIGFDPYGQLYAGGVFDASSKISIPYGLALWNNGWQPADFVANGNPSAFIAHPDGKLTIAGDFTGSMTVGAVN